MKTRVIFTLLILSAVHSVAEAAVAPASARVAPASVAPSLDAAAVDSSSYAPKPLHTLSSAFTVAQIGLRFPSAQPNLTFTGYIATTYDLVRAESVLAHSVLTYRLTGDFGARYLYDNERLQFDDVHIRLFSLGSLYHDDEHDPRPMTLVVSHGSSEAMNVFHVVVNPDITIRFAHDLNVTFNVPVNLPFGLPNFNGGTPPFTHSVVDLGEGGFPPGLTLNPATGAITGTPTEPRALYEMFYRVRDSLGDEAGGYFRSGFEISVAPGDPAFITANEPLTFTANHAMSLELPTALGGRPGYGYQLDGAGSAAIVAMPGLNFDADARTIAGTPTTPTTQTVLTYTATDQDNKTATRLLTMVIAPELTLAAIETLTFEVNLRAAMQLPEAVGGALPLIYALGGLPSELAFDAQTREVTGAFTSAQVAAPLTYSVVDNNGATANVVLSYVALVPPGLRFTGLGPDIASYTSGTASTFVNFPDAAGSSGYVYSLQGGGATLGNGDAIGGLVYNGARRLEGVPGAKGEYLLTYSITDADSDSISLTFEFDVFNPVVATELVTFAFTVTQDIDLTLPITSDPDLTVNYVVSERTVFPPGVIFDDSAPRLVGTVTATLTDAIPDYALGMLNLGDYIATDSLGSTDRFSMLYAVHRATVFTQTIAPSKFPIGEPIDDLSLPNAAYGYVPSGATGHTYHIEYDGERYETTEVIAGLSYDEAAKELTGTPTKLGRYQLTYVATDANNIVGRLPFEFTVTDPPQFTNASVGVTYTIGQRGIDTALATPTKGIGALRYAFSPALPNSLAFDANRPRIHGDIADEVANVDYNVIHTYSVTDSNDDSASQLVTVRIFARPTLPTLPAATFALQRPFAPYTLPEGAGGHAPLIYSLRNQAGDSTDSIAGLSFAAAMRTLTGAPSARGTYPFTYIATDQNGIEASTAFTVFINDPPYFADEIVELAYTAGQPAVNRPLPPAQHGVIANAYTLSPALPNNLAFQSIPPRIIGAPLDESANNNYHTTHTLTATDAEGASDTLLVGIRIYPRVTITAPASATFTQNQAIEAMTLPVGGGGLAPLRHELRSDGGAFTEYLGFAFDAEARELSGAPVVAGAYTFEYAALDQNDAVAVETFTLLVAAPLAFVQPQDDLIFARNAQISRQLATAAGGLGAITYGIAVRHSFDTVLPTLAVDANTAVLSASTGQATYPTTDYVLSAGDELGGVAGVTFSIAVVSGRRPVLPPIDDVVFSVGQPGNVGNIIAVTLPSGSVAGDATLRYDLTADRPKRTNAWLGWADATTQPAILQVPASALNALTVSQPYALTYTATQVGGVGDGSSARQVFVARVTAAPSFNGATQSALHVTIDGPPLSAVQLPRAVGGVAPLMHQLAPTVPANLFFDPTTLILSGAPSPTAPTKPGGERTTHQLSAQDANGAQTAPNVEVALTVYPALSFNFVNPPGAITFQTDQSASSDQFSSVSGGRAPLKYEMVNLEAAAGLAFPTGFRLSGKIGVVGDVPMTFRVTDGNGAVLEYPIVVTGKAGAALLLSPAQIASQTFVAGEQVDFEFPVAVGGTAPYNYTLSANGVVQNEGGQVFGGLIYAALNSQLRLFGAPQATNAGEYAVTFSVTDDAGAQTEVAFAVHIVVAPLAFADTEVALSFTLGQAAIDVALPTAIGNPANYALAPAPPGALAFTATPPKITGSADTLGETTHTLTATDAAATSATLRVIIDTASVPTFTQTQGKLHATIRGNALNVQLPRASEGTAPLSYAIIPTLPTGLAFDAAAVAIRDAPLNPADIGDAEYELRATDAHGASGALTFNLQVYPALTFVAGDNPPDATFSVGPSKSLTFLQAEGGRGVLAYSLDGLGALGGNHSIAFTAGERSLSGTFDAAHGAVGLTYVVADENGATLSYAFTIAAAADPNFIAADIATLNAGYIFRIGTAIAANTTLPQARDGASPLTHKLTVGATSQYTAAAFSANGIAFDAATRVLSGTPTAPAAAHPLNYHARDANGASVSQSTSITIASAFTLAQGDINLPSAQPIDVELDAAVGGVGAVVYTLSGLNSATLPSGVTFNPDARALQGTAPNAVIGEMRFVYTATDDFDNTVALATFTIAVSDQPVFTATRIAATYTAGAVTYTIAGEQFGDALTLPAASGGDGTLVYAESGNLPTDITRNADGNLILLSGMPTAPGDYTFTRTATDEAGFAGKFTFTAHVASAPAFAGTQAAIHATVGGVSLDIDLPTVSGGVAPVAYSIAPALPGGLQLNPATAKLSGAPNNPNDVGEANYTLTAVDVHGVSVALQPFALTVYARLRFVPAAIAATYTVDAATYTVSGAQSGDALTLPLAVGGQGALAYPSGTGALPDGITQTVVANRALLTGTPTTVGDTTFIRSVTDAATPPNRVEFTFTATVLSAPVFADTQADLSAKVGGDALDVDLPTASGGFAPFAYSITPPLPSGLQLNPLSAKLSGTPNNANDVGVANYTLTAVDAHGASVALQPFELSISELLRFDPTAIAATYSVGVTTYTIGGAQYGDVLTLPAASGSANSLAYAAAGNPPTGLTQTADGEAILLSGAPSASGDFTFTRTVTDQTAGETAQFTFTAFVAAAPAFAGTQDDLHATIGGLALDVDLPTASGGYAGFVYSISPDLPSGVRLNPVTAKLSGAPDDAGDIGVGNYTLTAVDANGASVDLPAFNLHVYEALAFVSGSNPSIGEFFSEGVARTLNFLAVTGGRTAYTYQLDGLDDISTVNSLAFDAAARTLSGTFAGGLVPSVELTYVATDANGATLKYEFAVGAFAAPYFTAEDITTLSNGYTFRIGVDVTDITLPAAVSPTRVFYKLTVGATSQYDDSTYAANDLTLSSIARTISGTPTAPAQNNPLVYHARYSGGLPASAPTHFLVVPTFTLTQLDIGIATGQTINLPLATAIGGAGTVVYTLAGLYGGDLPNGVTFNPTAPNSPALQGFAPSGVGVATFEYRATDGFDNAIALSTFAVSTSQRPTFLPPSIAATYSVGASGYTIDGAQSTDAITLPAGIGGFGALAHTISGALPDGITQTPGDNNTLLLTGAPTAIGDFTFIRIATDSSSPPRVGRFTFTATVVAAPQFTGAQGDLVITREGIALDVDLPTAQNGYAPLVYSITPALWSGLSLNPSTAKLSGVATDGFSTTRYTLTVTDAHGATDTLAFNLTVRLNLTFNDPNPPDTTYTAGVEKTLQFSAVTGGLGRRSGGEPLMYVYTLQGLDAISVAHSLAYDAEARTLSGAFAAPNNDVGLTYIATDLEGSALTYTLTIAAVAGDIDASVPTFVQDIAATYTATGASYTIGGAQFAAPLVLPAASGAQSLLDYTESGDLPSGLTRTDIANGDIRLSGAPTASGDFTFVRTVTNSATPPQTDSLTFSAHVVAAPRFTGNPANQYNATVGAAFAADFPAATDGYGVLSYTADELPNGLTMHAEVARISGTPSASAAIKLYLVTITARDVHGATVATPQFFIPLYAPLAFLPDNTPTVATFSTRHYKEVVLPEISGGSSGYVPTVFGNLGVAHNVGYSLTSRVPLVAGHILSSGSGSGTLTYRVTDSSGASLDHLINLFWVPRPKYAVDEAIAVFLRGQTRSMELPLATSAIGIASYALSPSAPSGLTFSGEPPRLYGNPVAVGVVTHIVTAYDNNGAGSSLSTIIKRFDAPTFDAVQGAVTFVVGSPDEVTLPSATASASEDALVYALSDGLGNDFADGNAIDGLTFAPATRELSGAPGESVFRGQYVLAYRATGEVSGLSAEESFALQIVEPLAFDSPVGDWSIARNSTYTLQLATAGGGIGAITYGLALANPSDTALPGLSLDAQSALLTGAAHDAVYAETAYVLTAGDQAAHTVSATFTMRVAAASFPEYAVGLPEVPNYTFTVGQTANIEASGNIEITLPEAVFPNNNSFTAGKYRMYSEQPNKADDAGQGWISWLTEEANRAFPIGDPIVMQIAPSDLSGAIGSPYVLTYQAAYSGEEENRVFTASVVAAPQFADAIPQQHATAGGGLVVVQLPTASGGVAPLMHAFRDTLPTALVFDDASLLLRGVVAASATPGDFTFAYGVTDANGASPHNADNSENTLPMPLRIYAPLAFADDNPGPNLTFGLISGSVQFSAAEGGRAPYQYSIDVQSVTPNVRFDGASRSLIGALPPNDLQYALTYRATDANGAKVQYGFILHSVAPSTISEDLVLVPNAIEALSFTLGANVAAFQLPQAFGGALPYTYALASNDAEIADGASIVGLVYDADARQLGGAPTPIGDHRLTFSVTDQLGNRASAPILLHIVAAPAFAVTETQLSFRIGATVAQALPIASGGVDVQYTLSPALPSALTFKADADAPAIGGLVGGSPDVTTHTLTATDQNAATASTQIIIHRALPASFASQQPITTFVIGASQSVQLPPAQNGFGGFVYTLSDLTDTAFGNGAVITGLTFAAATRTIVGTPAPSLSAGEHRLILRAAGVEGYATAQTFTLSLLPGVSFDSVQGNLEFATNQTISAQLVTASGGVGAITYGIARVTASDAALPGLAVDAATAQLTATTRATVYGPIAHRLTAGDESGTTANIDFTILVKVGVALAPIADLTFSVGQTSGLTFALPSGSGISPPITYALDVAASNSGTWWGSSTSPSITPIQAQINASDLTAAAIAQPYSLTYTARGDGTSSQREFAARVVAAPVFAARDKLHATINGAQLAVDLSASGGVAPLAYAVAPTLPSGLTLDAATAELTGAADSNAAVGNVEYTITATDANGVPARLTLDIQIYAALLFATTPADTTYTVGVDKLIALPEAGGGRGGYTYALDGLDDIAAGVAHTLTYAATERELRGAFAEISDDVGLTYTATDTNGALLRHEFTIAAVGAPSFTANETAALTRGFDVRIGAVLDETLPQATGGVAPLTHKLTADADYASSAFNAYGISYDAGTSKLSGTVIASDEETVNATYHVRDANGALHSTDLVINIHPTLRLAQDDLLLASAHQVSETLSLPENLIEVGGNPGAAMYTLTDLDGVGLDDLPSGMNFDAATRHLTGLAPAAAFANSFIYTATDTADGTSARVTFAITVLAAPVFPAATVAATYSVGSVTYTMADAQFGDGLTLPAATQGFGAIVYTAEGALPPGLVATAVGGRLMLGNAPTTAGEYTYVRVATDSAPTPRVGHTTFLASVVDTTPMFTSAQTPLHATIAGLALDVTLPPVDGGYGAIAYSVAPALPNGYALDPASAVLSGVGEADARVGNATYSVTAVDAHGISGATKFELHVYSALMFAGENPQSPVVQTARFEKTLTFSDVTGGRAPYQYEFIQPNFQFFDPVTRIYAFTAPGAFAATPYTYTVTDTNGAVLQHEVVLVNVAAPYFTVAEGTVLLNGYTFRAGVAIADNFTLPLAREGSAPLTHKLTAGAASAYTDAAFGANNIAFDADTRILSGTPSAATPINLPLVYHARDANGATVLLGTNIFIGAPFALTQGDLGFEVGAAVDITLPPATGGIGAVTYAFAPIETATLPGGITYNAAARALQGTAPASAVAAMSFAYTATDDFDDAAAGATFTIKVTDDPLFTPLMIVATYTVDASMHTTDGVQSADAVTLPPAVGGSGALVYTDNAALPPGIVRAADGDSDGILLTGAPTAIGGYTFVRTATDTLSAAGMFTFIAQVLPAPAFTATQDKLHATIDAPSATLNLRTASGGLAPLAYSIAPMLPSGMQLEATNAAINGAPDDPADIGSTAYTLTATDVHGVSATLNFDLQVYAALAFVAGDNPDDATFTVGLSQSLTFLAVENGRAAYAYSLDGLGAIAATNSLAFDAAERVLSGTFSAANADVGLTYVGADANGAGVSYAFTVAAVAVPNFATADQTTLTNGYTFRVGTLIAADTTLPQAQDGLPPLTHKLTVGAQYASADFGANDIAFDASTRVLSGTPIAPSTNHPLNYHARDVNGATVSQATNLFIAASFTLSQSDIALATGQAVDLDLTEAIGGVGAVAYTVAGIDALNDLPSGVTFNPTDRALQGAAPSNVVAEMTFEYTATDNFDGAVAVATFTIAVTERPTFIPATIAATYTVGTTTYTIAGVQSGDALTLPEAVGGVGAASYADDGAPPTGLTRTAVGNRILLSGAPTTAGDYTFTRTATDTSTPPRVGEFTFTANVVAAPSFADTQDDLHATIGGVALDVNLPTATGGYAQLAYSIAPQLPSGLAVNPITAKLSGTPDDADDVGDAEYTLTAVDVHGVSATLAFNLEVYAALAFAAGDNPDDTTFTVGTSTALVFLAGVGGRADLTYSLDGIDDVGGSNSLAFVAATRTLSGTFDVVSNDVGLTYIVTDNNGATLSYAFTVAAVAAPNFIAADVTALDDGYTFRVGTAIAADTTLPEAQNGLPPLTHKLTVGAQYASADFGANDIAFDASTRTLSGTPIAPSTNHSLNYHARDVNGATVSQTTNLFIAASFTLSQSDIALATGQSVDLDLTAAAASVGTVAYTVAGIDASNNLPSGVTFNPTDRALQGTAPSVAEGEMTFEYTATDGFDNDVAVATFTITVTERPAFTPAIIAATYTVGATTYSMGDAQSGDALTLPAAVGGVGVLVYTESGGLPSGIARAAGDGNTLLLTAAPDTAGETTFIRVATDTSSPPRTGEFTFIATVVAKPSFAATQGGLHATIGGVALDVNLPIATNGVAPLVYSIAPNLPSGLLLDASTAKLSGVPDDVGDIGSENYVLTATDVHGASIALQQFAIEVYAALAFAAGNNPDDTTFTVGTSTALVFLAATGGRADLTYSVDGIDDVGGSNSLAFVEATRTLSGTFDVVSNDVGLTYVVTDNNGATLSYDFSVAAVAAPNFVTADQTALTNGYTFRVGTLIAADTTLPQAQNGLPPLTHKLTAGATSQYADTAFVGTNGVAFDASTRALSGTPTASSANPLNYHARDVNGATVSQATNIFIAASFTLSQDDIALATEQAVDLDLTEAIGGVGTVVYTVRRHRRIEQLAERRHL